MDERDGQCPTTDFSNPRTGQWLKIDFLPCRADATRAAGARWIDSPCTPQRGDDNPGAHSSCRRVRASGLRYDRNGRHSLRGWHILDDAGRDPPRATRRDHRSRIADSPVGRHGKVQRRRGMTASPLLWLSNDQWLVLTRSQAHSDLNPPQELDKKVSSWRVNRFVKRASCSSMSRRSTASS